MISATNPSSASPVSSLLPRVLLLLPLAFVLLLSGCNDGTSGDAGTVSLSASQEAAAKKGTPRGPSMREGSISDRSTTRKTR
ncbi:MAG: hypothetical protein U0794_15535 [Isosphaeraceae bacterium]